MIKSYGKAYGQTQQKYRLVFPYDNKVEQYSDSCAAYSKYPPDTKLGVQIVKYGVWNVEINSIKRLLESTKITKMEKLLLEDHQNILQKEAWECRGEAYRLYEEVLTNPAIDKVLEEEVGAHNSLELPVTKRNIDFEKYVTLSPVERIHLLISQQNMLEMEMFALGKRRESLQLIEGEKQFLNYRIKILEKCISIISECITLTFYQYFKRDSPAAIEFYEEMLRAGPGLGYTAKIFPGKEYLRYPYDFKRPNEVPPDEWGSPDLNWKTGHTILTTR